jgi:hypothetical protein
MKTKKQKRIIISTLIFMVVVMYGFMPPVFQAAAYNSIFHAADLMSDTDLAQTATHTFTFTTATTTPAGGYWDIVFPAGFSGLATTSVTCAYGAAGITEQIVGNNDTVRCLFAGQQAATSSSVIVTDVINPNVENEYGIWIYNYSNTGELRDRVHVWVGIFNDIWMTATVNSVLDFVISGTSTAGVVSGVACTNASTASTTPFGDLVAGVPSTVCQTLNVTTNADDGYTVTFFQDNELTSDSGSNINSFDNAQDHTGSTTPVLWTPPLNLLDQYNTYGHMGIHTDDADLQNYGTGYENFNNGGQVLFAGLNSSDPMPIMHHTGPSDGHTQNVGEVHILYQAEIGSLQEAGDYESTLTYVCTPTF